MTMIRMLALRIYIPSIFLIIQQGLIRNFHSHLQKISDQLIALTISALQLAEDLNLLIALRELHPYLPSLPQQQHEYHIYQ